MHLLLIGCEVILRELCDAVVRSPHRVDLRFLSKGLHDLGGRAMREALQAEIDAADEGPHTAILLGYGLCGNGAAGLEARSKPLVMPRAHDCITLLMGSRERFETYFREHPGVYYRSVGWVERGQGLVPMARDRTGVTFTLDALVERYGEDNGSFLYEELTRYQRSYCQLTYLETGLGPDGSCREEAAAEAARNGWAFEPMGADLHLFQQLLDGDWDGSDFVVVRPGQKVVACYDDRVVDVEAIRP